MLLGLWAGRIVVQHDQRRFLRVLPRPGPALHAGLDEARHLVDEGRILELVLHDIEPILQRGDALVLILEDHEIIGGDTGVDHLPVLVRSEEHTSELQSLMRISYAVFCLKKKTTNHHHTTTNNTHLTNT